MSKKNPSILAGKAKSIPAYYEGQPTSGAPDHFISREHFVQLKAKNMARAIHRGTSALLFGVRSTRSDSQSSVKGAWKVTGQTAKPFRFGSTGPGFPRYNSVR